MAAKNTRTRKLHIGISGSDFIAVPLRSKGADELIKRGIVYECGDGHDLHLTPDHKWDVTDIETLLFEVLPPDTLVAEKVRRRVRS